MTTKIEEFVSMWNNKTYPVDEWDRSVVKEFRAEINDALIDVYCEREERTGELRISYLGKPLFIQAMNKVGLMGQEVHNLRSMYHLMNGHTWESIILTLMKQYDVDVSHQQEEVFFDGVMGHIDAIVNDDTVVDIKTMSASYFKSFVEQPDDNRGYITQIMAYRKALGVPNAGILCLNKWFGEMEYVPIEPRTTVTKADQECYAEDLLVRARSIIEMLAEVITPDDLPICSLPKPIPHKTGNYLIVPPELSYDSRKHLFWKVNSSNQIKDSYYINEVIDRINQAYAVRIS